MSSAGGVTFVPAASFTFQFTLAASATQAGSLAGFSDDEIVIFRGSILGLTIASDSIKTSGSAKFIAYINGRDSGFSLLWPTGVTRAFATAAGQNYPFGEGESLGMRCITSGYAPTAAKVRATLYISFSG